MTIKIIKTGNIPKRITFMQICDYCNTQFSFNYDDCMYDSVGDKDISDPYIKCPLCDRRSLASFNKRL